VSILSERSEVESKNFCFPDPFVVDDGSVGSYLLKRDPTGEIFGALRFMDRVEDWVLPRLGIDEQTRIDVESRLARLSEIVFEYRKRIPPDNDAFLKALSWLNTSVTVYVVDFLSAHQADFFMQLVDYSRANEDMNVDAGLMLKRVRALWRARLLNRIYSKENVDFVMRILFKESAV